MILVDTSVWVSFFRGEKKAILLQDFIIRSTIKLHPFVYGELLLGGLNQKNQALLKSVSMDVAVQDANVITLILEKKLNSASIGWVDAHLLAAALRSNYQLWSFDLALVRQTQRLGLL